MAESIETDFLESTVQQATLLLRAGASAFYLCDKKEGSFSLAATHNLLEPPWDEGLLERVVQTRQAVVDGDRPLPKLVAVPSIWRDHVRGVLVVSDPAPDRVFSDQDIALLQPLADLAAAVLLQAERLSRMTAQFHALHVIDIALTSSVQLDRVINLILEKAVGLVGAEHGSLRLLNPESGELVLRAYLGEGWTAEVRAYTFEIGHGITGWVAEHRRPYLCLDAHTDPQNVILFEEMQSGVAVPLLTRLDQEEEQTQLLGVLLLESTRPAAFDQHDVELLEALAQDAVIAIQNATQQQKLQGMHQALQTEQERRLAAEKWTVMGQAATALAHRINNLIGIVPASAGEIRRTLQQVDLSAADRAWIESNLSRIERNGRFVLKLADSLFRPFQEPGPRARFDVNRLLNEALKAANPPPTVEIIREYAQDLPRVESNSLLVDIFLELFTNACRAMGDQPRQQLRVRTRMESEEGPWVVIAISDTGIGFNADQMGHLWAMFKESADGLGFGLWWVRTFIERQGGTITAESSPGSGASFTVKLPVYPTGDLFEE
jgi:GAF domain-containing protein